jgi:hypothetical protein
MPVDRPSPLRPRVHRKQLREMVRPSVCPAPRRFSPLELRSVAQESSQLDVAQLLGYTGTMKRLKGRSLLSVEEETLNHDLNTERYFIIVKAYDLHGGAGRKPRQVWALHANIRGPGNNFQTALGRMSRVAANYFGHVTKDVETVRTGKRELNAKVEIDEMVILGMGGPAK